MEFRANFLKAFSSPSCTSMEWVHRLRTLLLTQLASSDRLRALRESTEIADAALVGLESDWLIGGWIPVDRFHSIVEFLTYSLLLPPGDHRVASSIEFKPDVPLLDFCTQIGRKSSLSPLVPGPPPAQTSLVSSIPSATVSSIPSASPAKSVQCDHCGRLDHSVCSCYQRKK